MSCDLAVTITPRDDALIVSIRGAGDLPGTEQLDRQLMVLLAQRPSRVVIDLSGLTLISSICMGSLIRFHQAIARGKGHVMICGARGIVLDALMRARLDQVFPIHPQIEDALRLMSAAT
jgi:anti-sigma B factor antagonist